MPSTPGELLQVADLRIQIGPHVLVDGVSFALGEGEALGIVGESGSGKSLTALALMGLLPPNAKASGQLLYAGDNLIGLPEARMRQLRGASLAMVFQDPMTSLNPHLRIGTQMAEVLTQHRGIPQAEALAESARLLEAVQLPEAARRLRQYPHELSGGQRQRVLLAMALLCRPRLLIADEPTTALDVTVQVQVLKLLGELRREFKLAVLLISHDLGVVSELCEQMLVLYAGRVMEQGATKTLLTRPRHPYTRGLLGARPGLQPQGAELQIIPGQPPRGSEIGAGCAFAPRCALRADVCVTERPAAASDRRPACHFDSI